MKETFIIGSGASLNSLTAEEVDYINASDLVISLNKYLIFYDKISIIPDFHVQFDASDTQSMYVFYRTVEKILKDKNLNSLQFVMSSNLTERGRFYLGRNRIIEVDDNVEFWSSADFENQKWAKNLSEKMFHFRGSLTSVINFANILRPNNVIKLVGVDMSSSEYFFQKEFDSDKCFHDWTYSKMKAEKIHSNIICSDEFSNLSQEQCIIWIKNKIKQSGGDLVSCGIDSYYVVKNYLEYKKIDDSDNVRISNKLKNNIDVEDRSCCQNYFMGVTLFIKRFLIFLKILWCRLKIYGLNVFIW